jgi:hypothetical protein
VGKMKRRPDPGSDDERLQARLKSIQEKCHPAMFEFAQTFKELIEAMRNAGPKPSKEAVEGIEARLELRTAEINHQYPDLAQFNSQAFIEKSIFSESALTTDSADSKGVFEWLHFERHGIPFKQDEEDAKKGDWEASRRIQRTIGDAEQLRCGKGPIIPFQGNLDHSTIFAMTWSLGIEKLTQEELADFFDKYCPCLIEAHDPDALKKHRAHFKRSLENNR